MKKGRCEDKGLYQDKQNYLRTLKKKHSIPNSPAIIQCKVELQDSVVISMPENTSQSL